ncbi:beta-defensin 38-like [Peromyscus californicus insignis]|uniref:beta-defensin 38-like n=1 Tax=Peromyscus californicus insignis TaxID=564181 RepID=UPI0022A6F00C|nr:beta-defensin 38-like [Peromyscus californicus insignis]
MKIFCFLWLMLCLQIFQVNPVAGKDTHECAKRQGICEAKRCKFFYIQVGTCFQRKSKCCIKRWSRNTKTKKV